MPQMPLFLNKKRKCAYKKEECRSRCNLHVSSLSHYDGNQHLIRDTAVGQNRAKSTKILLNLDLR